MIELMKNEEIHSYETKPINFKNVFNTTEIGIEYHKVNLFGEFLDVSDFKSKDGLENSLRRFELISNNFAPQDSPDLKGKEFELNNLLMHTQSVFDRVSAGNLYKDVLVEDKGILECIKYFQNSISSLTSYLARSNTEVENRFKLIGDTFDKSAERDELLKRLKDEFNCDENL
jgi:hypothetical protein